MRCMKFQLVPFLCRLVPFDAYKGTSRRVNYTQGVDAFISLVMDQHGAELLVDDRKICCFHKASSFGGLSHSATLLSGCSEKRCKGRKNIKECIKHLIIVLN